MSEFQPDSPLAEVLPSPNHGPRLGPGLDAIVLHYTGMATGAAALERLCDPAAEVSAHYVVAEEGRIFQLVPETRRAWHAGQSFWAGATDLNSASIGIEIVNGGHDFGSPPFPDAQIAAVIALCQDIARRHAVPARRILAHSDIAPGRKADPGERFPWARLAAAGVGHYIPPHGLGEDSPLALGAAGEQVAALQRDLAAYGYGLVINGRYDATTEAAIVAFQRHFRPARVDGKADLSTRNTLRDLLALEPLALGLKHPREKKIL
jgi:N-acetylmuramoyl-L-alanine amidase